MNPAVLDLEDVRRRKVERVVVHRSGRPLPVPADDGELPVLPQTASTNSFLMERFLPSLENGGPRVYTTSR